MAQQQQQLCAHHQRSFVLNRKTPTISENGGGEEPEVEAAHSSRPTLLELALHNSSQRFWAQQDVISPLLSAGTATTAAPAGRSQRSFSLPFIQKPCIEGETFSRKLGVDALFTTISALYGKLLVVMGIAFPMAEVISTNVPVSYYEGFYLYLYFVSLIFLFCMYCTSFSTSRSLKSISGQRKFFGESARTPDDEESDGATQQKLLRLPRKQTRYGSFYLRMGAVAFGIGSMIYSGLEFGQYFELKKNTKCHNVYLAITPITRMAFIIAQMMFIFMKNIHFESRPQLRLVLRFGLMHMIATNLCVWLNVLIQETKHEILTFYDPNNSNANASVFMQNESLVVEREKRGLVGRHDLFECRRTNIMGSLVQNASPFLFPCTIEYSLICAVILYAIWKSVASGPGEPSSGRNLRSGVRSAGKIVSHQASQHFSVDCANAHRGLFSGILVLVFTIISLIMFFVLLKEEEFALIAVYEFNICELTLYVTTTIACLCCMFQMRNLKYDLRRTLDLDNILLIIAQSGLYIYSMFSIIAGFFSVDVTRPGILTTASFSLIQTTCQTIFVLDAWWKRCSTAQDIRRKPGRQLVTFMLVTNMAMWTVNRLENTRADFHPVELRFYGVWAWTIITHVSMPLAIFYRFHSTVCLCEIWKSTYKMRLVP
ncbi:proton channel OtopLc-like [Neocloeon triangulifer]|uniref:proton channel OtopLc-like n=1 Tax=Neocloeon triangulifer TaxID=2078957 RepID=UPI00286F1B6E|nr:proton channel OtopLc-like [Neocloeon triangulifer]